MSNSLWPHGLQHARLPGPLNLLVSLYTFIVLNPIWAFSFWTLHSLFLGSFFFWFLLFHKFSNTYSSSPLTFRLSFIPLFFSIWNLSLGNFFIFCGLNWWIYWWLQTYISSLISLGTLWIWLPIDLISMLRYLINIWNMTLSYLSPVNTSHLLPKGNNCYL